MNSTKQLYATINALMVAVVLAFVMGITIGATIIQAQQKPTQTATIEMQGFSLDIRDGIITAIGLGDELADKYGCDYIYPSAIGNTCGNVEKTVVIEVLSKYNISGVMVSDDLKHNY